METKHSETSDQENISGEEKATVGHLKKETEYNSNFWEASL